MSPRDTSCHGQLQLVLFLRMQRHEFRKQLYFCSLRAEQDQSDCPGVLGGPSRSDDRLGLKGQIQQKECFGGVKYEAKNMRASILRSVIYMYISASQYFIKCNKLLCKRRSYENDLNVGLTQLFSPK